MQSLLTGFNGAHPRIADKILQFKQHISASEHLTLTEQKLRGSSALSLAPLTRTDLRDIVCRHVAYASTELKSSGKDAACGP